MVNEAKRDKSKNDLYLFLEDKYNYITENKDKTAQVICLIIVLFILFFGVKHYLNRDNSTLQGQMDEAYYLSTNRSLLAGETAPDPLIFENMAKTCQHGDEAAVLRVSAGEAHMKAGILAIEKRLTPNQPDTPDAPAPASTAAPVDPAASFENAAKYLTEVANFPNLVNNDIRARANYDLGIVAEQMAGIAKEEAAISDQLAKAISFYEVVVNRYPDSPFAAIAREKISNLAKPATLAFYKSTAVKYYVVPEKKDAPPADTAKPDTSAPLVPGDNKGFEKKDEFSITPQSADAKPADAKPADAKPADAKPADAKPADAKPADAKQTDAKPTETKPADAK